MSREIWGLCSVGKESACNAGDPGLIPGSGRPPGEGNGNHSKNLTWRILWTEEPGEATVHGVRRVRYNLATKPPAAERLLS